MVRLDNVLVQSIFCASNTILRQLCLRHITAFTSSLRIFSRFGYAATRTGIIRATASDKMIAATIEDDSISFDVQINTIPSLRQLINHEKGVGNQA